MTFEKFLCTQHQFILRTLKILWHNVYYIFLKLYYQFLFYNKEVSILGILAKWSVTERKTSFVLQALSLFLVMLWIVFSVLFDKLYCGRTIALGQGQ